jgi:hypothetical protein
MGGEGRTIDEDRQWLNLTRKTFGQEHIGRYCWTFQFCNRHLFGETALVAKTVERAKQSKISK